MSFRSMKKTNSLFQVFRLMAQLQGDVIRKKQ